MAFTLLRRAVKKCEIEIKLEHFTALPSLVQKYCTLFATSECRMMISEQFIRCKNRGSPRKKRKIQGVNNTEHEK